LRFLPMLKKTKEFPCTECGACCAKVTGPPAVVFEETGWILPNGACKNYDPATKQCMIYEKRPPICRVDEIRPPSMTRPRWHAYVETCCDFSHDMVYGLPRERKCKCPH